MNRARLVASCSFALVAAVVGGLAVAVPVAADPATAVRARAAGTTTTFTGLAFDTCTAPPLTTMQAWRSSPYRAVGVYVGGVNRGCRQPELTREWVAGATRMGWRLLPTYVGRQARCGSRPDAAKIRPATAGSQGRVDADDAVDAARALGMLPGTAVYADMEHYTASAPRCRDAVLDYLSAWVRQMHRRGFLAGVYAHQDSGALHLAQVYEAGTHARPDALWIARWDGSDALSGWPTVADRMWARGQRAKQFRGDHLETWGGVTLNIDSDRLDTPVATVARSYAVRRRSLLRARRAPARSARVVRTFEPGSQVPVACQSTGPSVGGSRVWDKLASGLYVPDAQVRTPRRRGFTAALPRCRQAYQVRRAAGTLVYGGPRARRVVGRLPSGALARLVCQRRGVRVGGSPVWHRLREGRWVSDRHLATPGRRWVRHLPRC